MKDKVHEHIAIVNWLPEDTYYRQTYNHFHMPLGFVDFDELVAYLKETGIYQEYLEYKEKKKKKKVS